MGTERNARTSFSSTAGAMPRWISSLRVVVHRCPAVPTAPKVTARTARSTSASSMTMTALLPPSSSRLRPRRWATLTPTSRPTATDPVNETSGSRGSSASQPPTSAPPMARPKTPSAPCAAMTSLQSACTAWLHRGVRGDGFQTQVSPHTAASAAFQAQTATGKLNAVMTATGPSGWYCSSILWLGRSEAMVRPCSCRDRPTAKSQMSIISCTSPSPSARIFPISSATSSPRATLWRRRSSPRCLTTSPRRGAGRSRHSAKRERAASMTASSSARVQPRTLPRELPVAGSTDSRMSPVEAIHVPVLAPVA